MPRVIICRDKNTSGHRGRNGDIIPGSNETLESAAFRYVAQFPEYFRNGTKFIAIWIDESSAYPGGVRCAAMFEVVEPPVPERSLRPVG